MDSTIRFPNQAKVVFQAAEAFRRLSPDERVLAFLDLLASGEALLEASPKREEARRLREASEEEWRRIQMDLFAKHAQSGGRSP